MNKIVCSCGESLLFGNDQGLSALKKIKFKKEHKSHLIGKFKIYPSELLQIARNMSIKNEEVENRW